MMQEEDIVQDYKVHCSNAKIKKHLINVWMVESYLELIFNPNYNEFELPYMFTTRESMDVFSYKRMNEVSIFNNFSALDNEYLNDTKLAVSQIKLRYSDEPEESWKYKFYKNDKDRFQLYTKKNNENNYFCNYSYKYMGNNKYVFYYFNYFNKYTEPECNSFLDDIYNIEYLKRYLEYLYENIAEFLNEDRNDKATGELFKYDTIQKSAISNIFEYMFNDFKNKKEDFDLLLSVLLIFKCENFKILFDKQINICRFINTILDSSNLNDIPYRFCEEYLYDDDIDDLIYNNCYVYKKYKYKLRRVNFI